jgi:hypothetical protein
MVVILVSALIVAVLNRMVVSQNIVAIGTGKKICGGNDMWKTRERRMIRGPPLS